MMHYYTNNVDAKSNEQVFEFLLRGHQLKLTTDIGVFSKGEVDFGSKLLIETFVVPQIAGDFLDVGCGYGPIGLSLAKSFETLNVHMVDVNERAVGLSRKNAQLNNISNVDVYKSMSTRK